jgi:hypothetical protein
MLFPVYWLFDFLSAAKGAKLHRLETDQPLRVGGLALQKEAHLWLVLCNYQAQSQFIRVEGIGNGTGRMRRLNQESMPLAASDPDSFRSQSEPVVLRDRSIQLDLRPYETTFVSYDLDG